MAAATVEIYDEKTTWKSMHVRATTKKKKQYRKLSRVIFTGILEKIESLRPYLKHNIRRKRKIHCLKYTYKLRNRSFYYVLYIKKSTRSLVDYVRTYYVHLCAVISDF